MEVRRYRRFRLIERAKMRVFALFNLFTDRQVAGDRRQIY